MKSRVLPTLLFICLLDLLPNNRSIGQDEVSGDSESKAIIKLVITEYTPANSATVDEATFKLLVANQSDANFDLLRLTGQISGDNGKEAKWEYVFKEGLQAGSKDEALVTCDLGGATATQIALLEVKALSDFELVPIESSMLSIVDGLTIASTESTEKSEPADSDSTNNSLLIDFTQPNIIYLDGAKWNRGDRFEVEIQPVVEEGIPALRARKPSFTGSPTNPNDYHLAR